jgi:enamine deaminase RidA (YjgF/YER057c/UK114 family)
MTDRKVIVPEQMRAVFERSGYAPAVQVGAMLYCAGQVGRTAQLEVIHDPEEQFIACFENLRLVLEAGGCSFEDVIDMTTYHVEMSRHMPVFRAVKNAIFPRGLCAWTVIGVSELAHPSLLLEIKCIALQRRDGSAKGVADHA